MYSDVRMTFGQHRGRRVGSIDSGYLAWLLLNVRRLDWRLREAIELELEGRDHGQPERPRHSCEEENGPLVDIGTIVKTWYREMSLRFHPDRDGSHQAMTAINCAHDRLKELAGLVSRN
jgi:hypothetical protein